MSDSHSNAYQKLSDMPLEHQSDFDWNRCPICFRTGVRHELESLSDLACSTHHDANGRGVRRFGGANDPRVRVLPKAEASAEFVRETSADNVRCKSKTFPHRVQR